MHNEIIAEIVSIFESLPDFADQQNEVARFIYQLGLLLHGQKDWYVLDTNRYPLVVDRQSLTESGF